MAIFTHVKDELSVLIGRIHGAIVAATGRSDRRRYKNHRDDRSVYTLQAIVEATIAS